MKTRNQFCGALTAALAGTGAISLPVVATAQSLADIVFLVDESGSMSGEHAFLPDFVSTVESSLTSNGYSTNFGLTGFGGGGSTNLGHAFTIDTDLLGNATDFGTAAAGLVTSGSVEDGYSAIDYALSTYTFTPNASVTLVLVTDEDRDDANSALDYSSILAELASQNITLVTVASVDITSVNGSTGISTDGVNVLVQNGTTVTSEVYDTTTSTAGTTVADYVELALATTAGCAADLDFLRLGGDAATAFAEAFQECVEAAAQKPPTGGSADLFLNVYRDLQQVVIVNQGRIIASFNAMDAASEMVNAIQDVVSQDVAVAEDVWGVQGLTMFLSGNYQFGEYDAYGNNEAFTFDGGGMTLGFDYALGMTALGDTSVGGAMSYSNITADVDMEDSSVKAEAFTFSLFGGFKNESGTHGRVQATYGTFNYDQVRDPMGSSGGPFNASPDGSAFQIDIELGRELPEKTLGDRLTALIDPFVGLTYDYRQIDGFTESNGGATVSEFEDDSFAGRLGIRGTLRKQTARGMVFGFGEVAYAHAFNPSDIFVPVSSSISDELITAIDENMILAKFAFGTQLENGLAAMLQYQGGFSEHSTAHAISAQLRMEF